MSKVFFGGSRNLSRLNPALRTRLRNLVTNGHTVLIGDASGADKAVQSYLAQEGYKHVRVYCMDGKCRNNVGNWETVAVDSRGKKRDFAYFAMKDARMSLDADYGFMIWDGESKGTLNNILNLVQQGKSALVYFSPMREFILVESKVEITAMVARCSSDAREALDKTIKLEKRTSAEQSALKFG
ncbi:MAG: hypothetical protein WD795_20020 [Woeseia sp.]